MPLFIDLFDSGRPLGRFNLPQYVHGRSGLVFRLSHVVHRGGNGIVFESTIVSEGEFKDQTCAVKFLRQQDRTRVDRFANEVRLLKAMQHPRIAWYFDDNDLDFTSAIRVPWMALELCQHNLRQHIAQSGPLDMTGVVSAGVDMCEAVEYIHSLCIIHRDIKPQNFVWDDSSRNHIQMIDFGIAKYVGEDVSARPLDDFTQHTEFVGPQLFSSPELIAYGNNKLHPVTSKSDLFQLGKVLWYIATGQISAGVPSRKECPAGGRLREIVLNLIDDDPDCRPDNANQVAELLRKL